MEFPWSSILDASFSRRAFFGFVFLRIVEPSRTDGIDPVRTALRLLPRPEGVLETCHVIVRGDPSGVQKEAEHSERRSSSPERYRPRREKNKKARSFSDQENDK